MRRLLTSAVLAVTLTAPSLDAETVLLDKTVAVIAARVPTQQSISVITRWDLEAQCKIEMIRRFGKEGLDKEPDKELRKSVLKILVEETLVTMELTRIGFIEIDENQAQKKLDELVEPFGSEEELYNELARFSITPEHLKSWIERSILVEKYIDAQFYMTGFKDPTSMKGVHFVKMKFRGSLIEEIKKRYRIWMF